MVKDARILDLVAELMRKGHGERHILERIKRAALQNEVISVNERKYIESLVEKFLRHSQVKQEQSKPATNPVTNPVTKPITKPVIVPEYTATKKRHIPIKKILMLAVTSAIVIAAYASIDTLELFDTNTVPVFEFSINTDAENYNIGDIISVYGNAKESVKISVLDESYNIIWFEEISPDSMNSYSILVIADGDGWSVGKYTIMASYGAESDSVMITVQ